MIFFSRKAVQSCGSPTDPTPRYGGLLETFRYALDAWPKQTLRYSQGIHFLKPNSFAPENRPTKTNKNAPKGNDCLPNHPLSGATSYRMLVIRESGWTFEVYLFFFSDLGSFHLRHPEHR